MLFIPITLAAAAFQVARNALQRGMMPAAGPWGATLVRFLFGLPFSLLFVLAAWMAAPGVRPHFSAGYFAFALTGATAQVLATACLLVSMRRAGFAVGTAMQQSSLPLAGVIGWLAFHDGLSLMAWQGVGVASVGLAVLTWPRHATGPKPLSGAAFGLASGLFFGFCLNAYRHAVLTLDPANPVFSAVATISVTQAVQSVVLMAVLAWRRPWALAALWTGWRESLLAGLCGALASAGWMIAVGLAPAAAVRAVGVAEAPMAALAGRRLFAERLKPLQLIAGALTAVGVVMTALG